MADKIRVHYSLFLQPYATLTSLIRCVCFCKVQMQYSFWSSIFHFSFHILQIFTSLFFIPYDTGGVPKHFQPLIFEKKRVKEKKEN